MTRQGRLQSAKHWLPTYSGRDVVRGYSRWYGVSAVCAILELRLLGVHVDDTRLDQAKRAEEAKGTLRIQKKARRIPPEDELDFILRNPDRVSLHQDEMWEYMMLDDGDAVAQQRAGIHDEEPIPSDEDESVGDAPRMSPPDPDDEDTPF
ncbi:MAG: hypothetical protein AB2A00_42320 [Myxococcota bacterium]